MIAGYSHRWQLEAQLAGFEHERRSARSSKHLEKIAASEAIFRAELASLGEGDYEEPKQPRRSGPFGWIERRAAC